MTCMWWARERGQRQGGTGARTGGRGLNEVEADLTGGKLEIDAEARCKTGDQEREEMVNLEGRE